VEEEVDEEEEEVAEVTALVMIYVGAR